MILVIINLLRQLCVHPMLIMGNDLITGNKIEDNDDIENELAH